MTPVPVASALGALRCAPASASRTGQRLVARLQPHLPLLADRSRVPGLRTARATVAAVVAFVVSAHLGTSTDPVLASLTALLVVQLTTYQTLHSSLERVASVLAGVLVALAVAAHAGLTWYSLGAVVGVSLVLGRLMRLGDNVNEVAISGMIVLAVGGNPDAATGRVSETLIGAGVGVAVNVLLAPPLHVRPAAAALRDLAEDLAEVLDGLSQDLRDEWSRSSADRWLDRARALAPQVSRADRGLARAEESARFHPLHARARLLQPRLRTGLTGLEHSYVVVRSLCRALLDRTFYVPEGAEVYPERARLLLAELLQEAAGALVAVGDTAAAAPGETRPLAELRARLLVLRAQRDALSELLLVDPAFDPAAWQQHGALLAAVDRLRVELDAATAPPSAEALLGAGRGRAARRPPRSPVPAARRGSRPASARPAP